MTSVGIICEYNPFHLGHQKQISQIRRLFGPETAIVCAMSGNYVQRGHPAIFDKSLRAKAALQSGCDLVVELPVPVSLSSAEGFAQGGVAILNRLCDTISFGSESGDVSSLFAAAEALLSPAFSEKLQEQLSLGLSFPRVREAALSALGVPVSALPNDILALEYCKAILSQNSSLSVHVLKREGDYHAADADFENPSASSLRHRMLRGESWLEYTPPSVHDCFRSATVHTLSAGERAILGKLRSMSEENFSRLPYGSEGLWRKFMHASEVHSTIEEILTAVKSKRYTRSRLDRMLMCGFLDISEERLSAPAPYVRVLALNDCGRQILASQRKTGYFRNVGDNTRHPYQQLEYRWNSLYGLFAEDTIEAPNAEKNRRVVYLPKDEVDHG